ncbi:hypothetical protein ASPTUDRAFT_324370 [Aspergillus tubingensis CBS 134.48]|uniref:Uncharacterized protein n=1 Tax=Aspergillus tubingensis (strain CBS 134.48) TaxID=767770 RepID=A0A1L9NJL9_ASPTC|nr:hypothetical protein ASPTUDRAFT_324370 [Aspergillus tubingensis CBS 134.48]
MTLWASMIGAAEGPVQRAAAAAAAREGNVPQFPSNAPAATEKLGNQAAKLGHQIRGREDATPACQFRPATAPTNYLSSLRLPLLRRTCTLCRHIPPVPCPIMLIHGPVLESPSLVMSRPHKHQCQKCVIVAGTWTDCFLRQPLRSGASQKGE